MSFKKLVSFAFLCCLISQSYAQNLPNNQLHLTGRIINSDYTEQGNWLGVGFDVGYSRYIFKKAYIDFSLGKGHFEGKNSSRYLLREDEKANLNLTTYGIGMGYDLLRTEKLSLAGQLSLNNYSYRAVTGLITDGEGKIKYRAVDPVNERHLTACLRIRNKLGTHTSLITNLGYDLVARLERISLSTGISFSF